ncbi:MAG: hypothetical protein RL719_1147, partial [Actinomycetota bacterium]
MALSKKKTEAPLPSIGEYERDLVSNGAHHDPHGTLGAHPVDGGWVIRTLKPLATKVFVVLAGGKEVELNHVWNGIWDGLVPGKSVPDYRIRAHYNTDGAHTEWLVDDPYRHLPTVGELDLHLIKEGRHEELWKVLGSHVRSVKGTLGQSEGTSFAVWAPNAKAVRVVGDFNSWNGLGHAMRVMGDSGVWELFIPGIGAGTTYKYEILTKAGHWVKKIDPL